MKKYAALALSLTLALALLAGCGPAQGQSSATQGASSPADSASSAQSDTGVSSSGSSFPATGEPASARVPEQPLIDYSALDISELLIPVPQDQTPLAAALCAIDSVPCGTAGATLARAQGALRALDTARLTKGGTDMDETIAFLQALTPAQLDYFTFQWQLCAGFGAAIAADPASYADLLASCGGEDYSFTQDLPALLATCDAEMNDIFVAMSCDYSWRAFTHMEPFNRQ